MIRLRSFAVLPLCLAAVLFSNVTRADGVQTSFDAGSCAPGQVNSVSTSHTAVIAGKTISYQATVGFMEVTAADAQSKACVFYTAYTVNNSVTSRPRPLTFAFNGGPGSASLWLHLGLLGPKRVDLGSDGLTMPKSLELIDNNSSLLDVSDVVMIDPVATGFSHPEEGSVGDKFFGVHNDYVSIGAFVQNFLNTYDRWNSPKYILGESYGGVRGPLLVEYLQDELDIGVDGLILISPALSELSLSFGSTDNVAPYWTFFPSFAATAWFHKTIAAKYQSLTVDEVYEKAKAFAFVRLRDALEAGDTLSPNTTARVAQQMSDFTGINKDDLIDNGLHLGAGAFFTKALKATRQVIGRYDARFVGTALPGGDSYFDPSSQLIGYPFAAGINSYLRGDLAWPLTNPYKAMANVGDWPGGTSNLEGGSVISNLANSLAHNPKLKVMIASGYFDLACPMGTVEYELSHLPGDRPGDQTMRNRIVQTRYFGGHMLYINPTALEQLKATMSAFINSDQ